MSVNKEKYMKITTLSCYCHSLGMISGNKRLSGGYGCCWKGMLFSFALKYFCIL